jgi:adenylylsulfate kinase-like enzyme
MSLHCAAARRDWQGLMEARDDARPDRETDAQIEEMTTPAIFLISGIQAAGKSTVAHVLSTCAATSSGAW